MIFFFGIVFILGLLGNIQMGASRNLVPAESVKHSYVSPYLVSYELEYNREDSPYLLDVWTVPDNFINTGLAYNPINHTLFCCHLDFSQVDECIEELKKSNGSRVSPPIFVNNFTVLIQGLIYDEFDDSFWVWGGDVPYEEKFVSHFTADEIELPDGFLMPGNPGMLDNVENHGGIWSKENYASIVNLYSFDGILIDSFDAGFGGEGIAFDPFDSTFWGLTKPFLYHIQRVGSSSVILGVYDNPSRYYPPDVQAGYYNDGEAEGLVVDPSDRTLWFNADQHFHGGIPNGNRCWHINPLNTYNKKMLIPWGLRWERGLCSNVRIENEGLRLIPGNRSGIFITPVIDLQSYEVLSEKYTNLGGGNIFVDYRGSDDEPTTVPLDHLTLPYYDANTENEGWGMTIPGEWSSDIVQNRFLQIRFTLVDNEPPEKPLLEGPTEGTVGINYTYFAVSSDPDEDDLSYFFNWGDGTNSSWTEFVSSGIQVNRSHTWSIKGTYTIKVKAQDIYREESEWCTLEIIMPKPDCLKFNIPLVQKLIDRITAVFDYGFLHS